MTHPTSNGRRAPSLRWRDERGFTLLELLVVLGILALLATFAAPQVLRYLGRAKSETAKLQINAISSAVELYALDNGGFPPQQVGLQGLMRPPATTTAGAAAPAAFPSRTGGLLGV